MYKSYKNIIYLKNIYSSKNVKIHVRKKFQDSEVIILELTEK